MTDINQIWVEQEATLGKNIVRERIDSIPGLNCYIGLIQVTSARMFQMELNFSTPLHNNFLRKFRGVEIQTIPYSHSKTEYTIILLEKELSEIFTMFIEDIVENLRHITDQQLALSTIHHRVNYWKKLFSRVTGELLSAEKQRGLFGELHFLKLLLHNSSNHPSIILSWRGADSANQDFTRNRNAVEIKTTKSNSPSVYISNEQQLDYTVWNHLFLGVILVTETKGSQNSLKTIIEEIRNLINYDHDLIIEFETRLSQVGIFSDLIEYYNEISYSVSNQKYFQVKNGFPVILRSNLQSEAVFDVKYQIEISSCSTFQCEEEVVIKLML